MKIRSLLFSMMFPMFIFAQVGIGTTTPGAQLDVVTDATATSERKGLQVDVNSTSASTTQSTFSLHLTNSSTPAIGGAAEKFGIYNNVSGAGTANRYGIFTEVFKPTSGATTTDMYGVYAALGQSTGVNSNSYGLYADITNAGNTANIYGVYSTVNGTAANDDIYSGYFLGGKFSIGQTTTDNYILPESRGTDEQIMQTDATGNVTWEDKNDNSDLSLVRAHLSGTYNQSATGAGWANIDFDTEDFDTNGEFNTATNTFTAGTAGYYRINASYHTTSQSNTNYYGIAIYVNGTLEAESTYNHHNTGDVMRQVDCLVFLSATNTVEVRIRAESNAVDIDGFSGKTYMEIQQVKKN
ncbi:hypothetical protein [uncultured Winogradskyella sp.]|uniref:hypothetical protein n=1 Tax=uncultured Winogradskyella sp. TaxID=395353 RepID=UPI00261F0D1F|nr:hypothetical protein [uncultured Winogradskyella sp.]